MNFMLSEEQELIRSNAREFALKYIEPVATKIDQESRHPVEVFDKLAELDMMGISYPSEYGGGGAEFLTTMIVTEELARSCATTGFLHGYSYGLIGHPILTFGNEEQKQKWMPGLAAGKLVGSFALTEPGAGTDVSSATTTAVKKGDKYILNGTKTFITNAILADVFVVFAYTDRSAGAKGMSCFLVPQGSSGLNVGQHFDKMGVRGSQTSEVVFKDCVVAADCMLGKEGDGFKIAMSALDVGRIGIAAMSTGITQGCLDESIKYSKERVQFKKPIASQQAIQWFIANMATDIDAARFLYMNAAFIKDQGKPFSVAASKAKLFCSECAARHTTKAVQIQGGYGFMKGAKVERFYRDVKLTEIGEGTSEAQRMIIAGSVLR
ncbi:acyl-CoA dehydrogenase family protein [Syntrophomonas wolfei]|jgi:butyryl-CoA dehydrogenase|uniref:Butyryl-CoA dehydrogenase n=1 Tax=Syntrophomonas wolfei subsp. wolfei (strain DSM 2245B / Goettingen) TaxID=335541 RepID=Q0AZN1_SYNWW|nr:acyl-CoA dehydrogenase family protein [Syntrophomonas wolfei]ABI67823.1 Butyryl-CoA dehydrogenase [Syntrophomonas wolfei subsp. wolfei str. Goettingen G311]